MAWDRPVVDGAPAGLSGATGACRFVNQRLALHVLPTLMALRML